MLEVTLIFHGLVCTPHDTKMFENGGGFLNSDKPLKRTK